MISVYSEIGHLEKVLVHSPGQELENLTPSSLHRLLFDDIPYLKVAVEEHKAFVEALENENVDVYYMKDLVSEALEANPEVLPSFIKRFVDEAGVKSTRQKEHLYNFLERMSPESMVDKMVEGVRTRDIPSFEERSIMDMLELDYPFYTDPMPNTLFQRDAFASIGCGVTLNKMHTPTRQRETIFSEYLLRYHPMFKQTKIPHYYTPNEGESIEGGDVLVLNDKTLAIGISERTSPYAIEKLANNLFFESGDSFDSILAINIPKTRAFMHLDTVLTQVDYGMFTAHPKIMDDLVVFNLYKKHRHLKVEKEKASLKEALERHLKRPVEIIHCGGDDVIASEREQWSDGANTLAVSPGKIISYSRNHVTNRLLRQRGIKVIEIPSSELSRGRGGPRCMSMPLSRKSLKGGQT